MSNTQTPNAGSGFDAHVCERCDIRHRAMCAAVDFEHLGALEQIVSHRRYAPNQVIFEENSVRTRPQNRPTV